jgi:hypothetical protein
MRTTLAVIALVGILAAGNGPAHGDEPSAFYVSGGYHLAPGYYLNGRFYSAPGYYYYTPGYYRAAPGNAVPGGVYQAPGRYSVPRQNTPASSPGRPWSPNVGGNFQAGGYGGMPHYLHARGWDSGAHVEWWRQEHAKRQARRP